MKYKYSVDENNFEDSYEFESEWCFDYETVHFDGLLESMAQEAAKDYYWEHDGKECTWGINFYIFDLKGKLLGCCTVNCELEPNFTAKILDDLDVM